MCTRILYVDGQLLKSANAAGNVVTGRNMDWATPLETEIWAFPANMERQGEHTIVPLRGHLSTAA